LCFGCGSENPQGLGLRFRIEDGHAKADYVPPRHLQGYPGRMHGGGVATVLDEAMGWAAYAHGAWAMTARFTMRFRRPVPLDKSVTVTGRVTRDRGRVLEVRSELRSPDGVLLADAEGLFVRVSGVQAEELRRQYDASIS
ncbi:MAG: PaaI family thioesterase, partial [Dehalococcoidia bacterium]|nr:PaaI family thioesterase [Dehalococcoidia bacterium]